MNGRQETNLKLENKIKELLVNAPNIIKEYALDFGNKTETTKLAYLRYVIDFCAYFNNDIFKLKKCDINKYMEHIKYKEDGSENKASIRAARLAGIKNFYSFLIENEYIENDPTENVRPPRDLEEREVVALTVGEINIIKNNILHGVGSHRAIARQKEWINRDLAIVTLGCTTGLRRTAITEINLEDVDFNNNTIKVVEKGNRIRIVHIGDNTAKVIREWIADRNKMSGVETNALFLSNRKQRIAQKSIEHLIKKYSVGINKHITPHKMRSSCATNLYDQTHDIYLVQEVLGHKNIANTRRYARLSEERKKEAADILNDLF